MSQQESLNEMNYSLPWQDTGNHVNLDLYHQNHEEGRRNGDILIDCGTPTMSKVWNDHAFKGLDTSQDLQKWDEYIQLGDGFFVTKEFNKALEQYKKALEVSKNAIVHKSIGRVYHVQGKFDDALEEYDEALNLDPNFASAINNKGAVYFSQKKIDEAVKEWKKARDLNPNNPNSYYNLALAYTNKRDLAQVIENCEAGLKLQENNAKFYYLYGNALVGQNRFSEALQKYKQALELDPHCFPVYINLLNVLVELEEAEEAFRICKEMILNNLETVAKYREELAKVYIIFGQIKKAIKLLNHFPSQINPSLLLKIALNLQGKQELSKDEKSVKDEILKNQKGLQASIDFLEAQKLKPKDGNHLCDLGELYLMKGELTKAKEKLSECLVLYPNLASAHVLLGKTLLEQEDYDGATKELITGYQLLTNVSKKLIFLKDIKSKLQEARDFFPGKSEFNVEVSKEEVNTLEDLLKIIDSEDDLRANSPKLQDYFNFIKDELKNTIFKLFFNEEKEPFLQKKKLLTILPSILEYCSSQDQQKKANKEGSDLLSGNKKEALTFIEVKLRRGADNDVLWRMFNDTKVVDEISMRIATRLTMFRREKLLLHLNEKASGDLEEIHKLLEMKNLKNRQEEFAFKDLAFLFLILIEGVEDDEELLELDPQRAARLICKKLESAFHAENN